MTQIKRPQYNDAYIRQTSPDTYSQIAAAKAAWETAHSAGDAAGMAAAHQAAENLRSGYGYSGGEDGSGYIAIGSNNAYNTNNWYDTARTQYQNAANAAAEVYRIAAEQGAARLEGQRPNIQAQYDDLARQAYANYMLEQKALPDAMARLGLQGQGAAETTAARQSNAYQNNVMTGESARVDALRGLDSQIADLLYTGQVNGAKAQADALMEAARGYPDYAAALQKQQNYEREQAAQAYRWQAEQEQEAAQRQAKQEQDAAQRQANWQGDAFSRQMAVAKILAQYGDFSGYAALGFNPSQIAGMQEKWRQEQAGI